MPASPTPIIVFLTGAPELDTLDWQDANLVSSFESPILRFLGEAVPQKSTAGTTQTSLPLPKWRALSLPAPRKNDAQHRRDDPMRGPETAKFESFRDAPGDGKTHDLEHLTFLGHSLAVLQNLDSSQIGVPNGTYDVDGNTIFTSESYGDTFDTDQSLPTSSDSLGTYSSDRPEQQIVNFSGPFTDLKRIPTARYLQSIHPQTMTINLVASVIAAQPARTVRLRKRVGEMDVIEVLLGDETRAGFNVTFWVPPVDSQKSGKSPSTTSLRQILDSLRAGDNVLLTHIALSDYQNTVSGQNLSRRITRNKTTLTVLLDTVTGLSVPVASKLQRVQNWSSDFIGPRRARTSPEAAYTPRLELPSDTQTQFSG